MKPDTLMIDGRAFSWRWLVQLRSEQLDAWKAARPDEPALFELRRDCRPATERSAAGRYREPSLLDWRPEDE